MTLEPRRVRLTLRAIVAPALFALLAAAAVAVVSAAAPRPAERTPAQPHAPRSASTPACGGGVGSSFDFWGSDESGGTFVLRQRLADGRSLCARAEGAVRLDAKDGSIRELGASSSLEVETRAGGRSQRMLVTGDAGGPRYAWFVDGAERPLDDAARAWLADALQVVAASREIGRLQGQVGELQGRIGSIQGELGSLQGEIGRVQGRVGGLQGKVGSIQGEQGNLQGAIGGHEGAIGGLEAARAQASPELRARIDQEIEQHRAAIRKLQAEADGGDLARRMADAEAELGRAQAASHAEIAELERKMAAVKADERIEALERQIRDLHADERIREIEGRLKPALERLNQAVARLAS